MDAKSIKSKISHLELSPIDYTIDTTKLAKELDEFYHRDRKCEIVNTRIPHTIDKNTVSQYKPSPETLSLQSEQNRKITSEDLEWNKNHPPKLTDCCVIIISRYFEKLKLLEELPCENRTYLLEILPTNLPLEITVPLINYEYYWKRRYEEEFGAITYPKRLDWNWKNIYLERHLRNAIESANPQNNDEYDLDDLLTLLEPYVQTLRITQLQYWLPPVTMEKDDIPEVYPDDHIDFLPIFKKCKNLDEVDLVYGMNDIWEKYEKRMFNVSIKDCTRLGVAVLQLPNLKILRIHRSKLEDLHVQALVRGLVQNTTIEELDLSHCQIGDQGALCLGKLIEVHPKLETLILTDNMINGLGGEGIGYALLQENSCPLISLDLRLNPLGHQGALGLMRSLVRGNKPQKLNMACCQFEDMTSYIFGCMLKVNKSLEWIDVSNNWFGEFGGDNLVVGLSMNENVKWLDIRETNVTSDQQAKIKLLLKRNNREDVSEDETDEEELAVFDMKPTVTFEEHTKSSKIDDEVKTVSVSLVDA